MMIIKTLIASSTLMDMNSCIYKNGSNISNSSLPFLEKYCICGPLYTALCTIALFLTSSSLAKTRSKFLIFTISANANYNIEHSNWYNMRYTKESDNFNQSGRCSRNNTSWDEPVCAASRSISSWVILFSSPSFFLFIGWSKTKYLNIPIA